jgi:hypothetical protein
MDISESIERAVSSYLSQWLVAHPYLAWMISHPLPSVGLALVAIFSLWGLIKAIGRGVEQIWLFLLTTPFRLLQPIFRLMWSSIRQIFGHNNPSGAQVNSELKSTQSPERIDRIVNRLQILSQEQANLLRELSTLTDSASVISETEIISDTQYKKLYAKLPKLH